MAGKGTPDLLRMQVDVNKAYDLLNMFKEAEENQKAARRLEELG